MDPDVSENNNISKTELKTTVEEDERSKSSNSIYNEELDNNMKQVRFALAGNGACSTKPTYAEIAKVTCSADKVSNQSTCSVLRESQSLKRIQ